MTKRKNEPKLLHVVINSKKIKGSPLETGDLNNKKQYESNKVFCWKRKTIKVEKKGTERK